LIGEDYEDAVTQCLVNAGVKDPKQAREQARGMLEDARKRAAERRSKLPPGRRGR